MPRHPAFVAGLATSVALQGPSGSEAWADVDYFSAMQSWTFVRTGTLVTRRPRRRTPALPVRARSLPGHTGHARRPGARHCPRAGGTGPGGSGAVDIVAGTVIAGGGFSHWRRGDYACLLMPHVFEWARPVALLAGVVGIAVAQLRRRLAGCRDPGGAAHVPRGRCCLGAPGPPVARPAPVHVPAYERRLAASFTAEALGPASRSTATRR